MHNTLTNSLGLVECSSIQGLAFDSVEPVRPEKTTKPKRFGLDWFSVFRGKTPRKRRGRHSSVSAEVTVSKAMVSYTNLLADREKYFQVGAGSVTGTVSGQPINESFGMARMKMPFKRIFGLGPKWLDVSSTWHNGVYSGTPPLFSSDPPSMNLDTLFISHENYKDSLWGQTNNTVIGLGITY